MKDRDSDKRKEERDIQRNKIKTQTITQKYLRTFLHPCTLFSRVTNWHGTRRCCHLCNQSPTEPWLWVSHTYIGDGE